MHRDSGGIFWGVFFEVIVSLSISNHFDAKYYSVRILFILLERHHNAVFISYMDKFLPNWKQLKRELNALPVSHSDWKY